MPAPYPGGNVGRKPGKAMGMKVLSLVVPCYNEEQSLPYFYDEIVRIAGILNEVEFEILLVDDGSKDKTLQVMRQLHEMLEEPGNEREREMIRRFMEQMERE